MDNLHLGNPKTVELLILLEPTSVLAVTVTYSSVQSLMLSLVIIILLVVTVVLVNRVAFISEMVNV